MTCEMCPYYDFGYCSVGDFLEMPDDALCYEEEEEN